MTTSLQTSGSPVGLQSTQRISLPVTGALILLVVAASVVRLVVITKFNVNWDEFFFLSQVHDYLSHHLTLRLQTFHVHLFGWLPRVSRNEVDQIVAARGVMLALCLVTAVLLYRIARRFTNSSAALFAVAAYLSVSWVIRSGASFRSDPIATCCVMGAFALLLMPGRDLSRGGLAGLSFALAGMFTIKTAIFLPSLALLLAAPLFSRRPEDQAARRTAAVLLSAGIGFCVLYWLHASSVDQAIAKSSAAVVASSLSKTVTTAGFLPQRDALLFTLRWDLFYWAFWLTGLAMVVDRIWRSGERSRWIEVAALALPVGSVLVYRNSYPYFYPFILAPASVLTAVTWQALSEPTTRRTNRVLRGTARALALTWFAASLILHGVYLPRVMPLHHQREVVEVVHRMFPRPVPYFDRSSLIASFPQAGFFMTTWGIDAYRQRGNPILEQVIRERQPPLLIADHPALDLDHAVFPDDPTSRPVLLVADREALRQAYVHYWGPIYVAGRRLNLPPRGEPNSFELRIAGTYTLEANGAVRIDGRLLRPGEAVRLARGTHQISADSNASPVTLRWGEGLYRPAQSPPALPVFLGF